MSRETSRQIVIAGAGLAGACAAMWLSRSHDVLILDSAGAGSGASATSAGLISLLMSKRARPVWKMAEAMDAFQETLEEVDAARIFRQCGVVRTATDFEQADAFRRVARELPDEAIWMDSSEVALRYAEISAPHGALKVLRGGHMSIPAFVRALLSAAARNGTQFQSGVRLERWMEGAEGVEVLVEDADGRPAVINAATLILCLGAGYAAFASLRRLRLHLVKGQTVSVAKPAINFTIPPVVGRGYAIPAESSLLLGSSYQHTFDTLAPEPEHTRAILARVEAMIPSVRDAPILHKWAGIRATVPGVRLPMLGPLLGHERVWIFTGLGSKGLLMAPMVARRLDHYMADPNTIPREIRVR